MYQDIYTCTGIYIHVPGYIYMYQDIYTCTANKPWYNTSDNNISLTILHSLYVGSTFPVLQLMAPVVQKEHTQDFK